MARTYREMMEEESPPWLLTTDGLPFMKAMGTPKDAHIWRMRQSVMTRYPSFGTASSVGLLGYERGIPRAIGEGLSSYAARVRSAWSSWQLAGTAKGMLRALYDTGYTNVSLAIYNSRRYTMDADREVVASVLPGRSWLFRGITDTYWARFAVLFPEPLIQRWIDDGVPASGSDEANMIRGLIRRWKPSHMLCDGLYIATSPETWGYFPTGGTWADAALWGDETSWTAWSY